jgi:hypothetical protein
MQPEGSLPFSMNTPIVFTPSLFYLVHVVPSSVFKINFNIIFFKVYFSQVVSFLQVLPPNLVCISVLLSRTTCPARVIIRDELNNI